MIKNIIIIFAVIIGVIFAVHRFRSFKEELYQYQDVAYETKKELYFFLSREDLNAVDSTRKRLILLINTSDEEPEACNMFFIGDKSDTKFIKNECLAIELPIPTESAPMPKKDDFKINVDRLFGNKSEVFIRLLEVKSNNFFSNSIKNTFVENNQAKVLSMLLGLGAQTETFCFGRKLAKKLNLPDDMVIEQAIDPTRVIATFDDPMAEKTFSEIEIRKYGITLKPKFQYLP